MNIFNIATQSDWYKAFLNPVLDEIQKKPLATKILDVGTGPGTLPAMIVKKHEAVQVVGVDNDIVKITDALSMNPNERIRYVFDKEGLKGFEDNEFDIITFCSVLFLLDVNTRTEILKQAFRILKPNGKIIVLSPTGAKSVISPFIEVMSFPAKLANLTFIVWKLITRSRARKWNNEKFLAEYSKNRNINYTAKKAFNNNAIVEVLIKK